MPLCDEDRSEVGRVAGGRKPFHIFEQLLALYLRCSAFCAPLPTSSLFFRAPWWKRDSEHLSSYKHHLETVAAWVWSQEFQEFKSLDFHFLSFFAPISCATVSPTCRHHSLRRTLWPVVDIGALRPRIFSRSSRLAGIDESMIAATL